MAENWPATTDPTAVGFPSRKADMISAPRSNGDKDYAHAAAIFLKTRLPYSEITVCDMQTGTVTAITHP
jgi:hypothetical protein